MVRKTCFKGLESIEKTRVKVKMQSDLLFEALPQVSATDVISDYSYTDSMLWHMLCYIISSRKGSELVSPASLITSEDSRNLDGGGEIECPGRGFLY